MSCSPSRNVSKVSGLEQTVRFLPIKVVLFHLGAPKVLRPEPETRKRSKLESEAESNPKRNFRPPQGEKSSEDSMKRVFLLIVIPALLVALGFAQTPAAGINTDQTNVKGCLGGSDGNYTIAQDNTGHIFKITSSSVDLKQHLGHDVALIGHKASSAATNSSLAVTELNMISEHCAAAAAAPIATVSTPSENAVTPAAAAAAPAAPAAPPAESAVTPAATVSTSAETAIAPAAPAAPPAETAVTPAVPATAPAATVTTPAETAVTPAVAATAP